METRLKKGEMERIRECMVLIHAYWLLVVEMGKRYQVVLPCFFFFFEKCGLALLWSDQLAISIISYSLNHILCSCEDVECGDQWFFSGINGYLEEKNKKKTW